MTGFRDRVWLGWAALGVALLVEGCGGVGGPVPSQHVHDLGLARRLDPESALVGTVRVVAPTWLRSSAMEYRLGTDSPGERHRYLQSRWAAPPAELVGAALSRALSGAGICRLEVDLDEFIQDFPTPSRSDGLLEARARLRSAGEATVLASRAFSLRVPAERADAPGGVAALTRASGQLAAEMNSWIIDLERDEPADGPLRRACTRR